MAGRNEVQIKILDYVEKNGPTKSKELHQNLNISESMARNRLHSYHFNGYLSRERDGKSYNYSLAKKGKNRLQWLRKNL